MRMRSPYRPHLGGNVASVGGIDADALLWRDAVVTNGGTVSAGRLAIISTFIVAEKVAGTWALTDDYWGLWAENEIQALTSLTQRRLATAVNAPTFTADRGYAFDGTTNYINTGFVPSTHGVAMTGTNVRIAAYERTNVAASSTWAAGALNTTDRGLLIGPRSGGGLAQALLNSATTTMVSGVTDSRGFTVGSRTAAVFEGFKNGVSTGTFSPATSAGVLATREIFIGAFNNAGITLGFRAASEGLVLVGASLSGAQELAQYNAVQAWATAVGAQV